MFEKSVAASDEINFKMLFNVTDNLVSLFSEQVLIFIAKNINVGIKSHKWGNGDWHKYYFIFKSHKEEKFIIFLFYH